MRHSILSYFLIACLPITTGCVAAGVAGAGAVGTAFVQEKSLGTALDDATASSQIKAKLFSSNRQKFAEVDIEVAHGLVLLSGRVNTAEDKVFAEQTAWNANGVEDVANQIKVERPKSFMEGLSDGVITSRVRSALIGSKTVRSVNFNVETYDGTVYLMGIARSQKELEQAAEKASLVPGVKEVISYVTLANTRAVANAPTAIEEFALSGPMEQAALPREPQPLQPGQPKPIGSPAYDAAQVEKINNGELAGGGVY